MPQTSNNWWKNHLGNKFESIHEIYLHNIGNLTLTGYNSDMSNYDFPKKRNFGFDDWHVLFFSGHLFSNVFYFRKSIVIFKIICAFYCE